MGDSNMVDNRPRPRSVLSFESKKSRRSSGSGPKLDLTEFSKDKKRLHTKADPSMAMNEAQPAAVALEESNLENIRRMTWKDPTGTVIADPDRSNPTRHRMERPLDTIRSFEAAVEGTYNSRRSTFSGRPASQMDFNGSSRPTSYYGLNGAHGNGNGYGNGYGNGSGNGNSYGNSRQSYGGGYYQNGRGYNQRPESVAEDYETRNSRYSYPARPTRYGSSPMLSGPSVESFYPSHGHQPSYDTITTGGGSYGTDIRGGNSTNPSSQNSSVDRFPIKPEEYSCENNQAIGYTNGPFSPVSPNYSSEQNFWRGASARSQPSYGRNEFLDGDTSNNLARSLAVPEKDEPPPVPIKLNTGSRPPSLPSPPKKQSWLKRRFSKNT